MTSDKEITEKELAHHIANTLYCGKCWRQSLVAVSEPKYLVRLLKFYNGEYSNNVEAAKRIKKSINNEIQKWEQKTRQEFAREITKMLDNKNCSPKELSDFLDFHALGIMKYAKQELKKETSK